MLFEHDTGLNVSIGEQNYVPKVLSRDMLILLLASITAMTYAYLPTYMRPKSDAINTPHINRSTPRTRTPHMLQSKKEDNG